MWPERPISISQIPHSDALAARGTIEAMEQVAKESVCLLVGTYHSLLESISKGDTGMEEAVGDLLIVSATMSANGMKRVMQGLPTIKP